MQGDVSKELISYQGRILVHTDPAEMEFIFSTGVKVVKCPDEITPDMRMDIKTHPDLSSYRWPLRRGDFNR
jgi:hypothetical protein